MKLSELKKTPAFKIATNIYLLIITVFVVWMLFFDENSYLTHREFNEEIDKLQNSIEFYKKKISTDKTTIEKLKDSLELQRYAREKYLMKKDNEEVYIIEFDTIKNDE